MNSHSTESTIIWVSILLIIIQIICAVFYLCFSKKSESLPRNNSESPSTNNSPSPSTNNFEVLNKDHPVERSLESSEELDTTDEKKLDEEYSDSDSDSDSGVLMIVPKLEGKKESKKESKSDETRKEIINSDFHSTEGYLSDASEAYMNDGEARENILITRRETILNKILSAFKIKYVVSKGPVNELIVGSVNLDKYLEEKVGLGNWTADAIDKEEILELCDTSVVLLQYYASTKDINYKNAIKNVIDKITNKMKDLEFDKMPSRFYWTDFACKFVTLLLTYDLLINYESGNLIYQDLIHQLIPTLKFHEWQEMNYKKIIHFLGLKLVADYTFEPDVWGYDYFDEILKILKDKFEEVEKMNLKTEVYNYDLMYQIYKCFC